MNLKNYNKKHFIFLTGFATFFFGFGVPAGLNLYLLAIHSPLVLQYRSSLMYVSSILGDGIILPIVNMAAISFLVGNKELGRIRVVWALIFGAVITAYFHIAQALQGLANWSMPKPWEWNFLGYFHALYMFAVASFLCLFYIVFILSFKKEKKLYREAILVTLGIIFFLILLRLDYAGANII